MAMEPSVTVVEISGDDDEEWGEEDEVVVWSKGVHDTTATANGDSRRSSFHHSGSGSVDHSPAGRREEGGHPRGLLIASLANLAISYNVVNVGLALKIMAKQYPSESTADESLVSSAAILGMMAGQLVFGALGDFLGRQLALWCTLLVCFAGAAGSALLTFERSVGGADIFQQLLYWRILLGVGAGGVYPLAATLARASSMSNRGWCSRLKGARGGGGGDAGNDGEDTGSTCVALMFSMQGVGYLAAHVTGLALLSALPQDSSWAWRLLLGLGAVLPLALVVSLSLAFARARRYRLVQSAVAGLGEDDMEGAMGTNGGGRGGRGRRGREEGEGGGSGASSGPARFWLSVRDKRRLLWKLVGTAGSWFLFDVTFYGNQLYEDDVLEAVFGGAEGLKDEAAQDSFVALVALPGYFVAVALIAKLGPRNVQVQGFVAMTLLFAVIGLSFHSLRRHAGMLMLLYSLTFFFSNFGPNSTTFMLPSLTFPDQVRGSLNGISAAAGKFGALLGSLMFKPAAAALGVGPVLVICGFISLAGGALTLAFVDRHSDDHERTLVGGGDSDDGFDRIAGDSFDGTFPRQELEMTGSARPPSTSLMAASNRRTNVAKDGHGHGHGTPASQNGHEMTMNGGGMPLGRGELSPGPSRGLSPMKHKRNGKSDGMEMGMYAMVGGDGADEQPRREFGMSEDDSSEIVGDGGVFPGNRREQGDGYRSGGRDERQTLALGRTGEVEGQMEVGGGGSRWGDDSDSGGSDAGRRSGLVEPA